MRCFNFMHARSNHRRPDSGPAGDYLLNSKYAGYVTAEDSFAEEGSLVLRNQKRSHSGSSPSGTYQYTSGWVPSMNRDHFNKGYVEVRAKFPLRSKQANANAVTAFEVE